MNAPTLSTVDGGETTRRTLSGTWRSWSGSREGWGGEVRDTELGEREHRLNCKITEREQCAPSATLCLHLNNLRAGTRLFSNFVYIVIYATRFSGKWVGWKIQCEIFQEIMKPSPPPTITNLGIGLSTSLSAIYLFITHLL